MRIPRWMAALVLQLLSLTSLTSASGERQLVVGFALSTAFPTSGLSEPSLDLDFIIQSSSAELRVPVMPLHLLGKKSWNVYNTDNVERVRRDEAAARAREEAREQHMQEVDAERRIQLLRGEIPTPIPEDADKDDNDESGRGRLHGSGRERKRRKRFGENDTEFEMRIAREDVSNNDASKQIVLRKPVDAPLVDHAGNIDLFPQDKSKETVEKNPEAEKEAARKKKEYEDQYTMRFSNAAGFKQGLESPWYSSSAYKAEAGGDDAMPGKDVWGNEDPRRKDREAARIVSNDPLAAMRQGAAKVRAVERERRKWREEKEVETRELAESETRQKKHKRRREDGRDEDEEDLEGFSLDGPEKKLRRESEHDRSRRHRHRDSRQRHGDRDRDRHRHRRDYD